MSLDRRESVQGGYCNWPDTVGCALTKLECDDPSNFLSSRQMQSGPVRAHGGSCRWQKAVKSTVLGKCIDDGGKQTQCASTIESCPPSENRTNASWITTPECTVETTNFGRCDYGTCVWSRSHCLDDNTWAAFDEKCSCDMVMVGACSRQQVTGGEKEFFCAVSKDSCDQEQSWIAPQEVKRAAEFDCFLCREEREATTAPVPETNTMNSSSLDMITDEEGTGVNNNTTMNRTLVIVIAILGTVAALLVIAFITWNIFRTMRAMKRATEKITEDEESSRPTNTADQISSNRTDDNMEKASSNFSDD